MVDGRLQSIVPNLKLLRIGLILRLLEALLENFPELRFVFVRETALARLLIHEHFDVPRLPANQNERTLGFLVGRAFVSPVLVELGLSFLVVSERGECGFLASGHFPVSVDRQV